MTRYLFALLSLSLFSACGDDDASPDADTGDTGVPEDSATDTAVEEDSGGFVPVCEEPTAVACIDESYAMLGLFDEPTDAAITDESEDGASDFRTLIDTTGGAEASSGGLTPTESYVYARFTETGLEKVEISDEDAFESMDWDIAFRRFVVRLNSGVSGPSCVTGARTMPNTEFDTLDAVPEGLSYRTEAYFTEETCDYVSDSGIGSPATALASFWSYSACVEMTGNVYVIALANGHHVKFQVLSYYGPEQQEECNSTGEVPVPSGAGSFRIRWALLD